jgi:hypothetical protein
MAETTSDLIEKLRKYAREQKKFNIYPPDNDESLLLLFNQLEEYDRLVSIAAIQVILGKENLEKVTPPCQIGELIIDLSAREDAEILRTLRKYQVYKDKLDNMAKIINLLCGQNDLVDPQRDQITQ